MDSILEVQNVQVTWGELCNCTAESGLNHRESHDLCFAVIPRHKLLELTFSEFHISSFFHYKWPLEMGNNLQYCNSKQTGGGLPDEHGVLSRELLGINVIVGLCFRTVSEGTFLPLRIFNSAMPRCFCHDYFYEHDQSKILE